MPRKGVTSKYYNAYRTSLKLGEEVWRVREKFYLESGEAPRKSQGSLLNMSPGRVKDKLCKLDAELDRKVRHGEHPRVFENKAALNEHLENKPKYPPKKRVETNTQVSKPTTAISTTGHSMGSSVKTALTAVAAYMRKNGLEQMTVPGARVELIGRVHFWVGSGAACGSTEALKHTRLTKIITEVDCDDCKKAAVSLLGGS